MVYFVSSRTVHVFPMYLYAVNMLYVGGFAFDGCLGPSSSGCTTGTASVSVSMASATLGRSANLEVAGCRSYFSLVRSTKHPPPQASSLVTAHDFLLYLYVVSTVLVVRRAMTCGTRIEQSLPSRPV